MANFIKNVIFAAIEQNKCTFTLKIVSSTCTKFRKQFHQMMHSLLPVSIKRYEFLLLFITRFLNEILVIKTTCDTNSESKVEVSEHRLDRQLIEITLF